MADKQIKIGLYDTVVIIPPNTVLAPGVHTFRIHTKGNSILSSVYVGTAGGSVDVRWYDRSAAPDESEVGAEYVLASHPTMGAFSNTRKIVPKIHNNARMEVTVTGGSAQISAIASVVADFPAEVTGPILNGQTAQLAFDGGLPIAVYDPSDGKFYLLQGSGGKIAVVSESEAGKVLEATSTLTSASGSPVQVLSALVPVGKTWLVKYGEVACRGIGRWSLLVNGSRAGGGLTGDGHHHDRTSMPGYLLAQAGQTVAIEYTYNHGPGNMPIDAFIGVAET